MKRVLAVVLTVAMLLACMFVMPAMADALAQTVDLAIVNPSFELDEPGKTITGWTKGYEEAEGAVTWDVKLGTGVTDGEKMIGVASGNGGNKWLSQEIAIPATVAPYMDKYVWTFRNDNTYCTYLKVTLYAEGADPVEMAFNDFDKRAAAVHESAIDITSAMTALENPTKVKIEIAAHNNGGTFDSLRLFGTIPQATEEESLVPNSSFENVTEGVVDNWVFANVGEETVLVSDAEKAYIGTNSIKLPGTTMSRADITLSDLEAGRAYLLQLKYKQLGNDAFVTVESQTDYEKLVETGIGAATGTTDEDLKWGTFKTIFVLDETDVDGVMLRLRNGGDENPVCYDQIVVRKLTNYNPENLILNGDFEVSYGSEQTNFAVWKNENTACQATSVETANGYIANMPGSTSSLIQSVKTPFYSAELNKNYNYVLTYRMNYNNGGFPGIWVRVRFEDGTSVEQTVSVVRSAADLTDVKTQNVATLWQWNDMTYDLSWLAQSSKSPIQYIDVRLISGGSGCQYDDIVLKATVPEADSEVDPDAPGPGDEEEEEDYELIPEEGNLLLNGSFEVGTVDSKKIPGWEQTGAENKYIIKDHPSYIDNTDGGKQGIYVDLASGLGDAGLKQTATIDTEAAWYVNYQDYSYELSYSAYAAGSIYRGYVNVIMTDANGKSYTRSYNPAPTTVWAVNKVNIDLTSQTLDVGGPVASIEVQLIASSTMYEMRWDGIKLAPVPVTGVYNLIQNESFEKDAANSTEITYWTQAREDYSFAVEEHAVYSAKAGDGGKKTAAITFPDTAENGAEAAIKQTVTIDTQADWYVNYEDYSYELSYKAYAAGSVIRGYVNVTLKDASGKTLTVKYAPGASTVWAMNDITIDLTSQVKGLGNAVSSIEIELVATYSPYGNGMKYDAVKLVPVYEKAMESIAVNGSFETLTEEGTLEGWRVVNTTLEESLIEDANEAHTGDKYLRFEAVENMLATATYEVEYGKTYMVEVFYKATEANSARIQLIDSAGRTHVFQDTRPEKPDVWTPARAMITIGKATPAPTFRLYLANMNEEAIVCFDSVKLYCLGDFDGNMVLNGDFEADNARNSEWENITNWFGGNAVKLETGTAHSGNASYAIRQQNNVYGHIMLNMDDSAATEEGEKFKLTFWINDSGLNAEKMPWVRLFPFRMNADTSISAKGDAIVINPVIEAKDTWTKCEAIVELPADVNYLKIQFFAGEGWTRFDDIEFVKYETGVSFKNADGKIITELTEAVDGTYTAYAVNVGDLENAKVFVAQYEVADGEERLVNITCKTLGGAGSETPCDIEVTGGDENTVVKAYLWAGTMIPVKTAVLK